MSVHFLYFYLNEKELNQQLCLIKCVEMKFVTLPLTKKEKEEQKHNPTSKTFLKLMKNFHKLHYLLIITNYYFYHLWSDPDEILKNKNWC